MEPGGTGRRTGASSTSVAGEILPGPGPRIFEVFQGLLQRLRWCVLQPERLRFLLPSRHLFRDLAIPRTEAAQVKDLLLERESTVEDQAARAGKPTHRMRL